MTISRLTPTPATGRTPAVPSTTSPAPGLATGPLPWITLIGGIIIQFADVMLAKAILDVVLNISVTVSWAIAICLSLAADLAAMGAGHARAAGKKDDMWFDLVAWAALGLSMFFVRWFGAALTADPDPNPTADKVLAVVMLALYSAAGAACIHASQVIFDPVRINYHTANRTIRKLRARLQKLDPTYTRIYRTLETARSERKIYKEERAEQANATADALEATLKDWARQQILMHLSSPTAAPLVRAPHQPEPGDDPAPER